MRQEQIRRRRRRRRKKKIIRAAVCLGMLLVLVLLITGVTMTVRHFLSPKEPVTADVPIPDTEEESEEPTEEVDDRICVCIDAGHGGKDEGSSYKQRIEKDDNLELALLLQEYLESQDVRVVMTRDDDTFLKLSARCKVANDAEADYMISLHRNKGDGYGVETWIKSDAKEETTDLGENIQEGLVEVGISRDRGVRNGSMEDANDDYYINAQSNMPSCIIELGFVNSTNDNALWDENAEDYAKAIGDAILATYEAYHSEDLQDLQDTQEP